MVFREDSKKRLRVLHLTPWYPSEDLPLVTPFVRAHFDALDAHVDQRLIHIDLKPGESLGIRSEFRGGDKNRFLFAFPVVASRVVEVAALFAMFCVRLMLKRKSWDVLLVHVAWPLLRYPSLLRLLFGKRVVLVEHWSAYSKNFNVAPGSPGHLRLQKMLDEDIPVVAVSEALAKDIRAFAPEKHFPITVVPNVVESVFHQGRPIEGRLFMAASWNDFRLPDLVIEAFTAIAARYPSAHLVIAGGGPKLPEMKRQVDRLEISERVTFLGPVDKRRIADEMSRASIFLHPATYETFSVITAEALSCGVPALVSHEGALPELVAPDVNGLLVENTSDAWRAALEAALNKSDWHRDRIAEDARSRFSPEVVGARLYEELSKAVSR